MDHADHLFLLKDGIQSPSGIWAEFGSGAGAFTLALVELTQPSALIYSVDRDMQALNRQAIVIRERFNTRENGIIFLHADYTTSLELPTLDGVLMANSLHFQKNKLPVLQKIYGYLRPGGCMILVEYNSDRGNHWVPFPLSFDTWNYLASQAGFQDTRLLAKVPSSFMGEIYSAQSCKIDMQRA
jgi:SAM-dependent methyltransferase